KFCLFFFSSRRRHTRFSRDWSSDVCSSDLGWRLDATVAKIKGPAGTIVRLKIIPAGQELSAKPKIVSLKRDKVVLEEQSAKKEIKTITSNGKTYRIGLITIPGFYVDFKALRAKDPNYKSTTRDVRL